MHLIGSAPAMHLIGPGADMHISIESMNPHSIESMNPHGAILSPMVQVVADTWLMPPCVPWAGPVQDLAHVVCDRVQEETVYEVRTLSGMTLRLLHSNWLGQASGWARECAVALAGGPCQLLRPPKSAFTAQRADGVWTTVRTNWKRPRGGSVLFTTMPDVFEVVRSVTVHENMQIRVLTVPAASLVITDPSAQRGLFLYAEK